VSNFAAMFKTYQQKPEVFFEQVLNVQSLESYQRRVLQAVAESDRVAIAACHDLGKTYTIARVVLWFATCFPYSKIITTAPTFNQVQNILWSEIRAGHSRAKFPLGGKLNLTDWHLSKDGDWFAIGFSPRNEASGGEGQGTASSFQGFHAPFLMVIFDEATGIPHGIWTQAEGLLTSQNTKFIAIGNPTSRASQFYKCFQDSAWKKVYLTCFDSPNFIANGITDASKLESEVQKYKSLPDDQAQAMLRNYKAPKSYLLTLKWAVQSIGKWGMAHPLTVSKILGKFPDDASNSLVGLGSIERAQLRVYWPKDYDRKILGVDVARFGTDETVITAMHGKRVLWKRHFHKHDVVMVTGEIVNASRDLGGADVIVVDETGLGGGVVDNLREAVNNHTLAHTCAIRGVQFGAGVACHNADCDHKDCDKSRYVNLKARMFGLLSSDIKSEDGITLPDNESAYLEELPSIIYKFDSKGRMVIESKEEYKKRTGRGSPDSADSLALANFGRYDEIDVGSVGDEFTDFAPPLAQSLGAIKSW
jgi:phage terminase large subunit